MDFVFPTASEQGSCGQAPENHTMTKSEFAAALEQLDLTPYRAGPLLGLSRRQAFRIAAGDCKVPEPVAKLLRASLRLGEGVLRE